jgi:hypothetical protein
VTVPWQSLILWRNLHMKPDDGDAAEGSPGTAEGSPGKGGRRSKATEVTSGAVVLLLIGSVITAVVTPLGQKLVDALTGSSPTPSASTPGPSRNDAVEPSLNPTLSAAPTPPYPSPSATSAGPDPAPTSARPQPPAIPNPYVASQQSLVLADSLLKPSSRWSNDHSATGECTFKSDGLHVSAPNKYHECYGRTSVTDFTYEVEYKFPNARVAGLFFRQSGPGQWYSVYVGHSGHVWLGWPGNDTAAEMYVTQPSPNGWHKLAVSAIGNKITVYVDGKQFSVTDGTYSAGAVGLMTDGGQPPNGDEANGETVFRNVRIWR